MTAGGVAGLRHRVALTFDRMADRTAGLVRRWRGSRGTAGPWVVSAYRGWATTDHLHVRARVVEGEVVRPGAAQDPWWRNAVAVLQRFASREVAGARLRLSVEGGARDVEVVTDGEGYARVAVPRDPSPPGTSAAAGGWHPVHWDLVEVPGVDPSPSAGATGRVRMPDPRHRVVIVSDLDDTVLRSGVTDTTSMLATVLFGNARTRLPFPGVAAFYRALAAGTTDGDGPDADQPDGNPLFYVSASPWNLYDVLEEFLRYREIPAGPLFLTDWGVDRDKVGTPDTRAHKLGVIEGLLQGLPDLPFVLIGDSGQHDPEIYEAVVERNPGRIRAVYIRDLDIPGRRDEVGAVATRLGARGVPLVHAPDTATAARHAHELELIDADGLAAVVEEVAGRS